MDDFSLLSQEQRLETTEELKNLFFSFSNSFDLQKHLLGVLSNQTAIANIAAKSYSHENGFDKIILFENELFKLRLHLWLKDNIKYSENIHNHRWDFCSKILLGSYKFENFQLGSNDNAEEYFEYEYLPKPNTDKYEMKYKGRNRLTPTESGVKCKNEIHLLEHKKLHKIISVENETATLFLTGKQQIASTNVFAKREINVTALPYRYISDDLLKSKIEQFLEIYKP
jgi:hypothetical protein